MTSRRNVSEDVWEILKKVLVGGAAALLAVLVPLTFQKYVGQKPFYLEDLWVVLSYMIFGMYFGLLLAKNPPRVMLSKLSGRWKIVTKAARVWMIYLGVWFSSMILFVILQYFKITFEPLRIFGVYGFYSIFVSFPILSLLVCIPIGRYISKIRVKAKNKKKVVEAFTISIPALGFMWLILVVFVLSFANINIDLLVFAVIYLVAVSVLYSCVVHFPYHVSTKTQRENKLKRLRENRDNVLKRLLGLKDDSPDSLLTKIALELEMARIDRKIQETKSKATHPFRVVSIVAISISVMFVAKIIDHLITTFFA